MKAKLIKFDLPINGTRVKNLEELRENLTDEIVGLARCGQLARWLMTRQLAAEAERVKAAVANESDDTALCMALCAIFDVDVIPEDVAAIFVLPGAAGTKLGEGSAQMKLKAVQILCGVLKKLTHKQFAELEKESGNLEGQSSLLDVTGYPDPGNGTVVDTTTGIQWISSVLGESCGKQLNLQRLTAVTPEQRLDMIREAACYKAEKHGFAIGHEADDWNEAEREVNDLLACVRKFYGG